MFDTDSILDLSDSYYMLVIESVPENVNIGSMYDWFASYCQG